MEWKYNAQDNIEPCEFYLSRGNKNPICKIEGITHADVTLSARDKNNLSLEIDKYVDGSPNPTYDLLDVYKEIYVPDLGIYGWFRIDEYPNIEGDGDREHKKVKCNSYETQLEDKNLTAFKVNRGEVDSLEMFDDNLDALGMPKKTIQLYNESNHDLSLLHILLKLGGITNWSVGHVDPTIAVLKRSFDIDSSNILSFLITEISRDFKCAIIFDTKQCTINAYDLDTIGKHSQVYITYRNLINKLSITPQNDTIYTRFNVQGGDDLDLSFVNFGSNYIEDLSYFMNNERFSSETITKYKSFLSKREDIRENFIDSSKQYNIALEKLTELEDRLPLSDIAQNDWTSYTLEDLETDLAMFKAIIKLLEELHTNESGVIDLSGSSDYSLYMTYKYVVIPDIEAEIEHRKTGSIEDPVKVDWETNWVLYGLSELLSKKSVYEAKIETYVEAGYDETWSESTAGSQSAFLKHQEELKRLRKELAELEKELKIREKEVETAQKELDAINQKRNQIAEKAQIDYPDYNFSPEELSSIQQIYVDTDFIDDSIFLTDYDDNLSKIVLQRELLESAQKQLYIESRPQLDFTVTAENIFGLPEFKDFHKSIDLYNYIIVGLDDSTPLKVKIKSLSFNLLDFSSDFSIGFASITNTLDGNHTFMSELEQAFTSQRNAIKRDLSSSLTSSINSITTSIFKPYIEATNLKAENAQIGNATIEDLKAVRAHVETLTADFASITELEAVNARIDHITANDITVEYLEATFATIEELKATNAIIDTLTSNMITTEYLDANYATIKNLDATNAKIEYLEANYATIEHLEAKYASIDYLDANFATIKYLEANYADINHLNANYATINYLEANYAEIDYLKANFATIAYLEADFATIKHLEANYANIDHLKANYATIHYLQANYADIDQLKANYASIVSLDAVNGHISNLTSDVASINSLLAGNLTSDNIQSLHLTTKNTTIENALIKNAVVSSITVGDLLAGTISTNKFTIASDDGGIQIVGATQQWRDSSNVIRMQAGKDASGNFSFSIFGKDGKGTLIDETGIYADAVRDGIIVDNMVADNANISGSKLDIASVVTEVNNSSYTLKSSRIKFDETNQSLDVYLSKLKEEINAIESSVGDYILQTFTEGDTTSNSRIATIHAKVYFQGEDITQTFPATYFIWTRRSEDPDGDITWNLKRTTGYSLTVTGNDVDMIGTYICTFVIPDEEDWIDRDNVNFTDHSGNNLTFMYS